MTYTTDQTTRQALETFRQYDIDTQLALLWFGYLDIKQSLTPNPPPSVEASAHTYVDRIQALPQDQQLQAQRDILSGANSEWGQEYTSLSSSGRMEVWLLLAQRMETGEVIPVPPDYDLPSETDEFTAMISELSFEQRIDFMRSAVMTMGAQQ